MHVQTISFISILVGISLLYFRIFPFFGWLLLVLSASIGIIKIISLNSKTNCKQCLISAVVILSFLAFLILLLSWPRIEQSIRETKEGIGNMNPPEMKPYDIEQDSEKENINNSTQKIIEKDSYS
jgi:hypothetical protein